MRFHFTYQTKNLVNGKTYVGVHSTKDLNDGYLGSGKALLNAVRKHGKANFIMTPLCFFDSIEEAYMEESEIVSEEWVKSNKNYNIKLGGHGGWEEFNAANKGKPRGPHSEQRKKAISEAKKGSSPWNKGKKTGQNNGWKGVTLTKDHRAKISKAHIGKKKSEESNKKASDTCKKIYFESNMNRSIPISVLGVEYPSLAEAKRQLGRSTTWITSRSSYHKI